MYKLLFVCLLLSPIAADLSLAQTGAIEIMCEDCRDPERYPDDYVNFAFNQIYGPDAWLSWDQADDFFVTNLDDQRVYVDVDFVFFGFGLRGFRLPLWPTNTLQFILALPSGQLYTTFRSIFLTSLPVPATVDDVTDDTDMDNGEDQEEDEHDVEYDDDSDDWDEWDESESDDYSGFTTIEDPDEDGNFDDPEWCEEC